MTNPEVLKGATDEPELARVIDGLVLSGKRVEGISLGCSLEPMEAADLLAFLDEAVFQGRIGDLRQGLAKIAAGEDVVITLTAGSKVSRALLCALP